MDGSMTITAAGASITIAAGSTRVPIPTDGSGNVPNYVRLAATGQACIRVGNSSVTATATDTLVQNADAIILRTIGMTHIAAIATGTPSGVVQISPLDDR